MSDNTLTQIAHYQKKLEKYAGTGDDEKLLYCIHKLKYLPVTVNHLEITGVGKSINGLRHKNGMIGEKAKALVQKWKLMVAQEEEQQETNEELESSSQDIDTRSQTPHSANNNRLENEEEYDPSEEGDRLQIEEDNGEESYNPGGVGHEEVEEEICNGYNPRTSREDYLSFNTEVVQEYTPTSKYSPRAQEDMEESVGGYSPLFPNGFDTAKKEKSSKSKEESKHKKKKHKSRHDREDKHKLKEESADSKKSKHKSSKKEKDKDSKSSKSSSSSSHLSSKSHSSSHKSDKVKTVDVKSVSSVSHNSHSNENNSTSVNNSSSNSSSKGSSDSSDKKRRREIDDEIESPSKKKSKVSDDHKEKEKKYHKSKSSKENHKSSKKKKELETSCDFEAALMGMEGTSSKKKKKKAKEKEENKSPVEAYSPSSPKLTSKFKDFKVESRDQLPNLPSSFEDDIEAPQLMTHYKPLPQVPLRSTAKDPFTNHMTDEEALNFMLSSKNSKQRRIYAGKATPLSSVPSLFDTCIRVLQENIDALEFMGGIPFDILKPVIEKATAQQLFSLEDYNPYLLEDTDVLWAAHCRKSFKNKQREDMETWRDMFIRCTDEHQEKMRTVTESLQKKYVTKAIPKRTTQLAFINTAAKLPKSVARAQARYGTASTVSTRPIKAEEQHKASSSSNIASSSSSSSSSGNNIVPVPKVEKPMPNKPPAAKKPKVAPLMGKARQLMKKVCRR